MIVLSVNVGSSSVKLSVYDIEPNGNALDVYHHDVPAKWERTFTAPFPAFSDLIASAWTDAGAVLRGANEIEAVGHRIVHGGQHLTSSVRITSATCDAIAEAGEYAPAHNALELAAINATTALLGDDIPQVAVFDSAFHATLGPSAYTYAGPYEWLALGIRRYGFHGVSHSYSAHKAAALLDRDVASLKIVTCHLGGGCSLAAVQNGLSVDTTMGFTPLDGIVMATRSGSVDPSIVLHLLRKGASIDAVERTLNTQSGLAGVSGLSGDMRELLAAIQHGNSRAQLALDVYVHRLAQGISAMAASMNGIDALVFTGGVGEHAPLVRANVCSALSFLGIVLDEAKNGVAAGNTIISLMPRSIPVVVVTAQENLMIAREAVRVAFQH